MGRLLSAGDNPSEAGRHLPFKTTTKNPRSLIIMEFPQTFTWQEISLLVSGMAFLVIYTYFYLWTINTRPPLLIGMDILLIALCGMLLVHTVQMSSRARFSEWIIDSSIQKLQEIQHKLENPPE